MLLNEKTKFGELLIAALSVYDKTPDPSTIGIWWNALDGQSFEKVKSAFSEHIKRNKFAPRPADIIALLSTGATNGRPGDDEAWAMMPRDEHTSVVMTNEMAEALGIAQSLLDSGDDVGARMAFKSAYNRIVEANSRIGKAPEWFASLGWDKNGREQALLDAVEKGRLTAQHVAILLPGSNLGKWLENGQQTGVIA